MADDSNRDATASAEASERIKKLRLENQVLEERISPQGRKIEYLKAYTSIGGLITAGVAALAFLASVFQISENLRRSDLAFEAERFGKALTLLSESRATQRLTGATYLGSFLSSNSSYRSQAAETLVNMMGLEDNSVVSMSIRDTLIDYITAADSHDPALLRVYALLVRISRTMTAENEQFLNVELSPSDEQVFGYGRELPNVCRQTVESQNQSTARLEKCQVKKRLEAISSVAIAIIRKGASNKNFAGAYCRGCDFSKLDLEKFDFSGAVLIGADFSDAIINEAQFRDANLIGANFRNSQLRGADFSTSFRENYVRRRVRTKSGSDVVFGPNFTCSDLSGAKFANHPVFRVHLALQTEFFADMGPNFWWANLDGTDFSNAVVYGVTNDPNGPFKVGSFGYPINVYKEFFYQEWHLIPDSYLQIDEESPYWPYLGGIEFNIINANWHNAKWPAGIRSLLEKAEQMRSTKPPPKIDDLKWVGGTEAPSEPPSECLALRSASSK